MYYAKVVTFYTEMTSDWRIKLPAHLCNEVLMWKWLKWLTSWLTCHTSDSLAAKLIGTVAGSWHAKWRTNNTAQSWTATCSALSEPISGFFAVEVPEEHERSKQTLMSVKLRFRDLMFFFFVCFICVQIRLSLVHECHLSCTYECVTWTKR